MSGQTSGFKERRSLTSIHSRNMRYLLLRHRHFKKLIDNLKPKRRGMNDALETRILSLENK
jgi:hypothetical protein